MRCYQIDEKAIVGIYLTSAPEGLCIEVGDKRVPVDSSLAQRLESARGQVVDKLRGCQLTRKYAGADLTDTELEEVADLADIVEREHIALTYADVDDQAKLIVRERGRHRDALVLVETAPGPGGSISFKSTAFDEYIDKHSNRVRRSYHDLFPTPGVQVIEEGTSRQGGRCFLLRMMPNSSFRMERTGELDGEPSVLTVIWKGPMADAGELPLRVFSPSRPQGN